MNAPAAPHPAYPPLPDLARLRPRQQMAMDCALCARPLGASGRRLGEVSHQGLPFQLWGCAPDCQATGAAVPNHPATHARPPRTEPEGQPAHL